MDIPTASRLIHNALVTISTSTGRGTEQLKEPLKQSINQMIAQYDDPKSQRFMTEDSLTIQVRKKLAEFLHKTNNESRSTHCSSSYTLGKAHGRDSLSGLAAYSSSFKFSQSIRQLSCAGYTQPGPACYDLHFTSLQKTPATVFSSGFSRGAHLQPVPGPGPCEYFPVKEYSSK